MKLNHKSAAALLAPVIVMAGILIAPLTADEIVLERGPDHRLVQFTRPIILPDGSLGQVTNRYVALETGMHYWQDGEWKPSDPTVRAHPQGAAVLTAPFQVIFPPDLSDPIAFTSPAGQKFQSKLVGLIYTDRTTGKMVLVGKVKPGEGFIFPPSQVVYQNVLDGITADLAYQTSLQGLEQNVVLREILDPKAVGMNDPKTVEVSVVTEFINPPPATVSQSIVKQEKDPVLRAQMTFPDLVDSTVYFMDTHFGRGTAFSLPPQGRPVSVRKRWDQINQSWFLTESISYVELAQALQALPVREVAAVPRKPLEIQLVNGQPQYPVFTASLPKQEKQLAMATPAQQRQFDRPGYVIDYQQNLSGSATNYVFDAATNYLVTGTFNVRGDVVFTPQVVIKFVQTNYPKIKFFADAKVTFQGTNYQPVFLTSVNDSSIGDVMGTNTPSSSPSFFGLWFDNLTNSTTIHDLRISYATGAIYVDNSPIAEIKNCQFTHSTYGLVLYLTNSLISANNLLFSDVVYGVTGNYYDVRGAHWTVNGSTTLATYDAHPGTLRLTNSLLSTLTSYGACYDSTNSSYVYEIASTNFVSAVAGWHYLPTNSSYRNAGTTNLPASLLADLQKRTVTAPLIYSNTVFTTDTNLGRLVDLDTDTPDLGYHYTPLDYLFYSVQASNCTLSLTGGVAVALHGGPGVWLNGGSKLISQGLATKPNVFTIYPAVQEQPMFWGTALNACFNSWHTNGANPELTLDYSEVYAFGHFIAWSADTSHYLARFNARHSRFNRGELDLGGSSLTSEIRNCLFEYGYFYAYDDGTAALRNNLFYQDTIFSLCSGSNPWLFKDNVFDHASLLFFGNTTNSHNVYVGTNDRLTPTNGTEVILTNITYVTGPLGNYYLSTSQTNLIDNGSVTNAGLVGLYHFCTSTNQVKEGFGTLDRGLHYVALDANGNPVDSDGDGVPDYLEDANGNGLLDMGETDWQIYTTLWSTNSPGLQVFTPLK